MNDKTEGLSYVEAIKVYVRTEKTGERVVDSQDWQYWIQDGRPMSQRIGSENVLFGHLDMVKAPFRIIKPAPKPVTLEDCLRAKRVKVTPPEGVKPFIVVIDWEVSKLDWMIGVPLINTAIANGWQVEILEE